MNPQLVWKRMKKLAGKAGAVVIETGLTLWFCMMDRDTPFKIRALILGDLVYLVSPIDAIPDAIPVIGFTDDLGVMLATLAAVAMHIKPEHRTRAKEVCAKWLRS